MAIELNYDDIVHLAKGAGAALVQKTADAGLGAAGTGQDLMQGVNNLLDRVNTTMTNFKEMVSLVKGIMPGGGPALSHGPGPGAVQPYQPQPTMAQQLHRVVNIAYSVYGDITMVELLQAVLQQYGNTKLSAVLKALQKS